MRAFGYWYGSILGNEVINNVRWGTPETYDYCFDGIPKNSIVSIGTISGSPRKLQNRSRFDEGLSEMMKVLSPHTILVYGSANFQCFKELEKKGVTIIAYQSRTDKSFARRATK